MIDSPEGESLEEYAANIRARIEERVKNRESCIKILGNGTVFFEFEKLAEGLSEEEIEKMNEIINKPFRDFMEKHGE